MSVPTAVGCPACPVAPCLFSASPFQRRHRPCVSLSVCLSVPGFCGQPSAHLTSRVQGASFRRGSCCSPADHRAAPLPSARPRPSRAPVCSPPPGQQQPRGLVHPVLRLEGQGLQLRPENHLSEAPFTGLLSPESDRPTRGVSSSHAPNAGSRPRASPAPNCAEASAGSTPHGLPSCPVRFPPSPSGVSPSNSAH